MARRKPIRKRGKIPLSKYFQKLKEGDRVSIVPEIGLQPSFPLRYRGLTGVVTGTRGRAYLVKIKDQKKEKTLIIEPIHLKKIKQI